MIEKIEKTGKANTVYWVGLCLVVLLLYSTDNPLRNSLPVGFTTYGQEIAWNHQYSVALTGQYRSQALDLAQELEETKAEACIAYEIEAFCFHRGADMRDKWDRWYEDADQGDGDAQ